MDYIFPVINIAVILALLGLTYWYARYTSNLLRQSQAQLAAIQSQALAKTQEAQEFHSQILQESKERRQAEERLQESEARFAAFMRHLPGAAVLRDAHGCYRFANDAWETFSGRSREDWFHRSLEEVWPPDLARRFRESDLEVLRRGQPLETIETLERDDGKHYWLMKRFPIPVQDEQEPMIGAIGLDITPRRQAEEALSQEKERFRLLVEESPLGISIISPSGHYKYVNSAFVQMFGYTLAEVPHGRAWFSRAFPDPRHRQEAIAAWKNDLLPSRPGAAQPRTFKVTCKNGFEKVINFRAVSLSSGDRIVIYEDVTARHRAQEELKQSELKYRLLVNQIPAVAFKGYADWSVDFFDEKVEALTGYAKELFDSRQLRWSDLIPPEEMEYVQGVFLQALKTNKSYVREHRIRKQNGDYAWVQCRGQIFCDAEGKVEYISGVTFDITERKRAEEALRQSEHLYRLLAENVRDVIWTSDLDLSLTFVSPSVQLLCGYSPEEIMAKPLEEVITPASVVLARETLAEALDSITPASPEANRTWTLEMEIVCKDGSTLWAEVLASFLWDAEGRPVGILGVSRDISKRKSAEAALRRREAILEAVSFAAGRFLQSASWEEDIMEILARLGQAVAASRAYIFENALQENGDLTTSQRYEWVAPDIKPMIDDPRLQNLSWQKSGFGRWQEELSRNRLISCHVKDLPPLEQEFLQAQDIYSILVVPIFTGQHWWGFIGFDECLQEREWSLAELEALKAAAGTLGAAILHERDQKALKDSENKLRSLSCQLLAAQENERKRLAAELHDELGHALLTLKLNLESLESRLKPEQVALKKETKQIIRFLLDTIEEVRRLYLDLSPGDLEDLGLTNSLEALIGDFAALQKGIKWTVHLEDLDGLFPLPVQTAIYRVVQEALTNIGKHARPREIYLSVKRDAKQVSFTIADNGQGFDMSRVFSSKKTLGLLAMEERVKILGGSFALWSQPNQGTRVSFTIPFEEGGN